MDFKDMFKGGRLAKDLQQNYLADLLGVVPAYISRLEKGFSLPSNELIVKICSTLDLDIKQVFLQVTLEKTESKDIRNVLSAIQNLPESGDMQTKEDEEIVVKINKLEPDHKKVITALLDTLTKQ